MKKEVELCDICSSDKAKVASNHCCICNCALCDEHDFGGENSFISIEIMVYNDMVIWDEQRITPICSVCHRCTDVLKDNGYKLPLELIEKIKKDFDDHIKNIKKKVK